jgi:hypothetical protein
MPVPATSRQCTPPPAHTTLDPSIRRAAGLSNPRVTVDGQPCPGNRVAGVASGRAYQLEVEIPA